MTPIYIPIYKKTFLYYDYYSLDHIKIKNFPFYKKIKHIDAFYYEGKYNLFCIDTLFEKKESKVGKGCTLRIKIRKMGINHLFFSIYNSDKKDFELIPSSLEKYHLLNIFDAFDILFQHADKKYE